MYIQLTTKCSMSCSHCCYGCNTKDGEHMPLHYAMKALQMCKDYYDYAPYLGGGEPTLHPNFREILIEAIATFGCEDSKVGIITNGTVKKNALLLARLAKGGVITSELSTDAYHDVGMISAEVWAAYENLESGFRGGADTSVVGQGSAIVNDLAAPGKRSDGRKPYLDSGWECACEGTHFRPNGLITWCGCQDAPVTGTIASGRFEGTCGCWRNADEEGLEETMAQIMTLPINQTWKALNHEEDDEIRCAA